MSDNDNSGEKFGRHGNLSGEAIEEAAANKTRASAVRYLRAMASSLRKEAESYHTHGEHRRLRLRDAALLEAAALDLEQRLDLDPERLRELGVTT